MRISDWSSDVCSSDLFGRKDEQAGIAARELDAQLLDIRFLAAERRRQRQRHRPGAGIDRAEEQGGEFGSGFGDEGDSVSRGDPARDQAIGAVERIAARSEEHTSELPSLMRHSY